jgi:hypothetical protein
MELREIYRTRSPYDRKYLLFRTHWLLQRVHTKFRIGTDSGTDPSGMQRRPPFTNMKIQIPVVPQEKIINRWAHVKCGDRRVRLHLAIYHYINIISIYSTKNVHNIWKCFILIGWLMFTIFEQLMMNLDNIATGTMPVWNDFPRALYMWNRFSRVIFIYFWQDLPLLKQTALFIVFCQYGRFGNVNAGEFTYSFSSFFAEWDVMY